MGDSVHRRQAGVVGRDDSLEEELTEQDKTSQVKAKMVEVEERKKGRKGGLIGMGPGIYIAALERSSETGWSQVMVSSRRPK